MTSATTPHEHPTSTSDAAPGPGPAPSAPASGGGAGAAAVVPVTAALIGTIALQTAVPPFATDMYTPAFLEVASTLQTTATAVGLTLTAFFVGLAAGQLVGGPLSDQRGRRLPLMAGGLLAAAAAVGCALAPNVWVLVAFRVLQGFGGGVAASVARAVVVDVAHGDRLARIMSVLMSLGGLAPMVAPVAGALVVEVSDWRGVFWTLMAMGLLMTVTAALFVPESLPAHARHAGGLRQSVAGMGDVVRRPDFVGYMLTSAASGFAMFAYVADASYVLRGMHGLGSLQYSFFFAGTALAQVVLSLVNARLVGRVPVRRLVGVGLTGTTAATVLLVCTVAFWGTALVPVCIGFALLMASQAFVFGNSSALATANTRHVAGSASAVLGIVQACAMAVAAPLASAGGAASAVPMVLVMAAGALVSWTAYLVLAPRAAAHA